MRRRRLYHFFFIFFYPLMHLIFRVKYHGRARIPAGPFIVCAPHSSVMDPLFLGYLLGYDRCPLYMAKKELFGIPVLGRIFKAAGAFPVDRGAADIGSIHTALRILQDGGIVGIFPEGTRVQAEDGLQAKTGVILLAARSGASILPVYLPRKKRPFRRIDVVAGEPYTIEKLRGGSKVYEPYAEDLARRLEALGEEARQCGSGQRKKRASATE